MAIIPSQELNKNLSFATPDQEKQKQLFYVFGLILVALGTIVYFGFYGGGTSFGLSAGEILVANYDKQQKVQGLDNILGGLKATKLDNSFFQNKKFEQLTIFGQLPIVIGPQGRDNPFAPF